MAISSAGVGSGLDVKSIVSQLVAIEKQPLTQLQTKATSFQTQLSLYGKIKSQAAALGDAAALLAGTSGWNTQKASSSNAAVVGVTAGAGAATANLTVEVTELARAQSAASAKVAVGTRVNQAAYDAAIDAGTPLVSAGKLSIQLGAWTGPTSPPATNPVSAIEVDVAVGDTMANIASKINAAKAGVTATVLRDGAGERLVIRSDTSGLAGGFSITSKTSASDPTRVPELAQFEVMTGIGATDPVSGMFMSQSAKDAEVILNGVTVKSASNTMKDVIPGVTLQLTQKTAVGAPVDITIENDLDATQKNIQSFVDAYNTLNQTLADATKYTAATKTGGPLQGDATTVGLQNALRAMMGSSSTGASFPGSPSGTARLSDVGIERQTDGSLKINQTKLTSAKQNLDNLKNLFAANNNDKATNGFGLKVRDFARGLVAFDGLVSNKSTAIQGSISRNAKDQDRVTDRAARVEAQLFRQYSALDAQMAQLNGLNSYVTAQLAQWNKSTG